jgi:hypothetical protein
MIQELTTLRDLHNFLSKLNDPQLDQPIKFTGAEACNLLEAEVTEEPFLEHKEDKELAGYESEVKVKLDFENLNFNPNEFKVLEPKDHVWLHLGIK